MLTEALQSVIMKWSEKIGEKEVVRRLTDPNGPDLSVSIATKLAAGRYTADLSFSKGQAILRELAKDGFSLGGDEVA